MIELRLFCVIPALIGLVTPFLLFLHSSYSSASKESFLNAAFQRGRFTRKALFLNFIMGCQLVEVLLNRPGFSEGCCV